MNLRLLIPLLFFPLLKLKAVPDGIAGPFIGAVESDGVTLWMYAPSESQCTYTYHSNSPDSSISGEGQFTEEPNPAAKGSGRPFKTSLTGLSPDTHDNFEVTINGKSDPS